MFPRLDPVIHGDADTRHQGPLPQISSKLSNATGFCFSPLFFDADEIRACTEELHRLSQNPATLSSKGTILEPGREEVCSIFAIHEISTHFQRLAQDRRIQERVQQLLGSDVYIHQSRINYKPGFNGTSFNWHSDFETWHAGDGMLRMRAVSCSIVLTDNNEFNRPLMLIPAQICSSFLPGRDTSR